MSRFRRMLLLLFSFITACEKSKQGTPPSGEAPRSFQLPIVTGEAEGRVFWRGEGALRPAVVIPSNLRKYCGDRVEPAGAKKDPDGGLAEVVISLKNAPGSKQLSDQKVRGVIDQQRCRYTPEVIAVQAGGFLEIRNSDPILHNVRAETPGHSLFNVAMPLQGLSVRKPLPQTEAAVELHCDLHPWMSATVKVFPHPYFAVSGPGGHFYLQGFPVGRQTLILWHRQLGTVEREIIVSRPPGSRQDLYF